MKTNLSLIVNVVLFFILIMMMVGIIYMSRTRSDVRLVASSSNKLSSANPDRQTGSFPVSTPTPTPTPTPLPADFSGGTGLLEEMGKMSDSPNPNWWLDSGGEMFWQNGIASTLIGELSKTSRWRMAYALDNAVDTDNGYHPQNLFRLVGKTWASNGSEQVYFRILTYNASQSTNRNESNGVFLFNHYQDQDNLYYVGLRVDGTAVIKKKIRGTYYTIAQTPVFTGSVYDRNSNPNLLPAGQWIGLKSAISVSNDTAVIDLFVDTKGTGAWQKVLTGTDNGKDYEKPIFTGGYGGIRSDFMDAQFKGYQMFSL